MPDAPLSAPADAPRAGWRNVFLGPVRLRAGWRFAAYVVLTAVIGFGLHALLLTMKVPLSDDWTPGSFIAAELSTFAIAIAATAIMARVDGLPFERFGLALHPASADLFWEGAFWGGAAVVVLVAGIAALGGYHIRGWSQTGGSLPANTLLWLAAMALVGLSEETSFRGYPLAALADGIGFWPASVVLSIVFAALHYFFKPMESIADGLSVGLLGLFLCFTLRRTGSLWFAIGFHFAFDFAAVPFFGAPNSGNHGRPVDTRLLDSSVSGPDWLTGGACGIEASWLVFAVIAALFALLRQRFPDTRFPPADAS